MLQKLNERIQGLVAWIIVVLVAVTFTLFGLDYYLQSRHEITAIAEVNGHPINDATLRQEYSRQTLKQPHLSDKESSAVQQQVLQDLIVKKVAAQAAHKLGFDVSPAQANAAIISTPKFQHKGKFSTAYYANAVRSYFFTPASFQKEVQNSMLLNQQQFAFVSTDFVLSDTFNADVSLFFQTRDYDYLNVPAKFFLPQINVSPVAIENYYKQHTEQYLEPEQVSIDYINLNMHSIKDNIIVTPAEIKNYYNENQKNAVLDQVRENIKQQLITEKSQAAYASALEQLSELSYENPESLSAAANALNLPVQHSEFFAKQGGTHGITQNQQVVRAAFKNDVLEEGNNSAPITLSEQDVIVLRINQRHTQKTKSLEQVKDRIEKKLALQAAKKMAVTWAQNFLSANKNKSLISLPIKIPGITWQQITNSSRTQKQPGNKDAFNLKKPGSACATALSNGDAAVIQLKTIKPGTITDQKKIQTLYAQWSLEQGGMIYEVFIHDLVRHAEIKRNGTLR